MAADECRMTKISGRVTSCCVVLFLVLTCVSAVKRLNSISDLKKINFGQTVPKHSLLLLHWFANAVEIDNNGVIRLTFDPNSDYGSHHYGNYEELLDPLPRGYRYFTVGNLYQGTDELPDYVVNSPREYVGRNRDRIIIRVREQRIDQVYITQHYDTSEGQGTAYDPDHTYQITTNLLRQLREFSVRDNQMPLLYLRNRFGSNADDSYIRNTWGDLACLGLLLFIVIEEKYCSNQRNNRLRNNNTAAYSNRQVNSNRSVNSNRPVNNNILINIDPETNNTLESMNSQGNRQGCRCSCAMVTCVLFILFVFVLILCLCVYFLRRWIRT